MPRDQASVRLITEQGFVEQLGYQIVEKEHELRAESGAVPGFPVQRHDHFSGRDCGGQGDPLIKALIQKWQSAGPWSIAERIARLKKLTMAFVWAGS